LPSARQAEASPAQNPDPPEAEAPAKEYFEYKYQVASLAHAAAGERLCARLHTAGISSAQVEKSGNWYRVVVLFRGGPEDVDKLRVDLSAFGIKNILLKSKTAVTP
jgi:cell division protein FtsN